MAEETVVEEVKEEVTEATPPTIPEVVASHDRTLGVIMKTLTAEGLIVQIEHNGAAAFIYKGDLQKLEEAKKAEEAKAE